MLAANSSWKLTHVRLDIINECALTQVCLLGIRSKVKRASNTPRGRNYKSSPNYHAT